MSSLSRTNRANRSGTLHFIRSLIPKRKRAPRFPPPFIALLLLPMLVAILASASSAHFHRYWWRGYTAPRITNFTCTPEIGDYWTISGNVTDINGPVQGMVIHFGGVLANYGYSATVNGDGTFSVTGMFINLQNGMATAHTVDWQNQQSNLAWYIIAI
jgi:hypothetical protein